MVASSAGGAQCEATILACPRYDSFRKFECSMDSPLDKLSKTYPTMRGMGGEGDAYDRASGREAVMRTEPVGTHESTTSENVVHRSNDVLGPERGAAPARKRDVR